jgi:hypothetical protein
MLLLLLGVVALSFWLFALRLLTLNAVHALKHAKNAFMAATVQGLATPVRIAPNLIAYSDSPSNFATSVCDRCGSDMGKVSKTQEYFFEKMEY